MSIDNERDVHGLRQIARIVSETLRLMRTQVRPGLKTRELDAMGAEYLRAQGARSAPQLCYDFPGATCISVNNEVAHGIPGSRRIKEGDLVNIDVSAELGGYFADTGASFVVGRAKPELQALCDAALGALNAAASVARDGAPLNSIGQAIESYASRHGYTFIRNLCSHGVGRALHEYPTEILPYHDPRDKRVLREGMVITIEPFISNGAWLVDEADDGWTLKTAKHYRTAQFEHTMIITRDAPMLLTSHA